MSLCIQAAALQQIQFFHDLKLLCLKCRVVETLKDYAVKALVNTVDHLGSITYKVNDFIDEKVDEVAETELRVSCIEQRLRMCQEYMDHEGRSQQSLVIDTPKFHKRYILPAGETIKTTNLEKLKYFGSSLEDADDWNQFRNGNFLFLFLCFYISLVP